MISAERLRELLSYDLDTGVFIWRHRRRGIRAGDVAGYKDRLGYINITIEYRRYFAHRLSWFYVYGYWPPAETDHRDHDRSNNRISNLRLATSSQNGQNSIRSRNNISGVKGVHWVWSRRCWQAQIKVQGKKIWLGYFRSLDEAAAAYKEAAIRYHGEFAYADRV